MRAVQIDQFGGPEVLQLTDVPRPAPGADETLVEIDLAGINFADIDHRRGERGTQVPLVLGTEGVGTVAEVGADVSGVAVGERVSLWNPGTPGTYAEFAIAPAARLVPVPDDVPSPEAAAMALQGLTAHALTRGMYPPSAGETCLIHSGAGGVGQIAVQLAKASGATVFTTVGSAEKADYVREIGADHAILYKETDFKDVVLELTDGKGVDVVYDGIGNDTIERSIGSVRSRGHCIVYGYKSGGFTGGPATELPLRMLARNTVFITAGVTMFYLFGPQLRARSEELFALYRSGDLKLRIGGEFGLDTAAAAHTAMETGGSIGKLVIRP